MKEKLKVIKIIHLALCSGVILAYIFLGNVSDITNFDITNIDSSDIVYLLIPFLAYFLSNFLFKSQLKNIDTTLDIEENFQFYQTASLTRWAILEGAAFAILFMKRDFMILGVLIILYLIFLRPTLDRIKTDLAKKRLN
ncbi:MFS transporter [Dokdonia sp.]|uniref:MFS transporter n=1 Tax=Dokdonia sp. TaxID=2024995 RepID=UPI0032647A01